VIKVAFESSGCWQYGAGSEIAQAIPPAPVCWKLVYLHIGRPMRQIYRQGFFFPVPQAATRAFRVKRTKRDARPVVGTAPRLEEGARIAPKALKARTCQLSKVSRRCVVVK
jgi:hypothetical protein